MLVAHINEALFAEVEDGRALAQAIVDTIREPLLVLDRDLQVVAASRSFYTTFEVLQPNIEGRHIYALGDGQWNIPELRVLLEEILPRHTAMEAYEVEQTFPGIGLRTMVLNARAMFNDLGRPTLILLAFEDVTGRRVIERQLAELAQQKETLLKEMPHRVANSLQIIASILAMKARAVKSAETRADLEDAQRRVSSVAAVQQQLQASLLNELVSIGPYLMRLCEALTSSMIGDDRAIAFKVHAEGAQLSSSDAMNIGLIVTELLINAIKYAFPHAKLGNIVVVTYVATGGIWHLTVSDNGIGSMAAVPEKIVAGLGTSIIEALARQLGGSVEVSRTPRGTTVSVMQDVFDTSRISI